MQKGGFQSSQGDGTKQEMCEKDTQTPRTDGHIDNESMCHVL